MKKRLHRQFVLVSLVSILLTTALVTAVFYELFKREIIDELRDCTELLENAGVFKRESLGGAEGLQAKTLRVTWIAEDGTVLFDNDADAGIMDNHGDRPEIAEALETGEGQAIRRSGTLNSNTFYFARRMADGSVVRVAKEASSIWQVFMRAFPAVLLMALLGFALCLALSTYATRELVRPVEHLAGHLGEEDTAPAYPELTPFISMIRQQHRDIVKNAKLRQEFTANVSHELKTPLTSISGYAELIEHGMVPEKDVPRFAGEIRRSSRRLLSMINDIIRLSELDTMESDSASFERVPLYQLAENCVDMLQVNAEKHQVTLDFQGTPCHILGNKEMVEETLYNLVDNAIRYNSAGGRVLVTAEPEGEKARLTVEDTGIGISKENQKRVFERFYRVDKSRSKATGGTGLGLAIVKHIVAWHRAELTMESELGKGTKITILFENAEKTGAQEGQA